MNLQEQSSFKPFVMLMPHDQNQSPQTTHHSQGRPPSNCKHPPSQNPSHLPTSPPQ
ncbi:hypothetical protein Sjap_009869 [Stephania japonica]|uniref:Uncharacterized protein n=1 Tax=Stephania japonica TaxID=461633 RepID=A0AAP0P353_9MAGN